MPIVAGNLRVLDLLKRFSTLTDAELDEFGDLTTGFPEGEQSVYFCPRLGCGRQLFWSKLTGLSCPIEKGGCGDYFAFFVGRSMPPSARRK